MWMKFVTRVRFRELNRYICNRVSRITSFPPWINISLSCVGNCKKHERGLRNLKGESIDRDMSVRCRGRKEGRWATWAREDDKKDESGYHTDEHCRPKGKINLSKPDCFWRSRTTPSWQVGNFESERRDLSRETYRDARCIKFYAYICDKSHRYIEVHTRQKYTRTYIYYKEHYKKQF